MALFAWIGSFSAPLRNFDLKTSMNGVLTDAAAFNKQRAAVLDRLGHGETAIHDAASQLHTSLDAAGIKHVVFESAGTSHEWQTWRRSLNDFAPRLWFYRKLKSDVTKSEVREVGSCGSRDQCAK